MADKLEKLPLKAATNGTGTIHSPDVATDKSPGGSTELCEDASGGPPVPPDGGYGWVILCASFFINFLVDGVCFSFGIFFLEFLDEFDEGKETTSWVGSVLNGMYLTMGPVVGALANKFGCRSVTIAGSIMASSALFLSTFSTNIYVLIITYGLLTGAGFGLMYLPAIVMVGYYFEKRRAFATGIAVCGSGIGAFVFAPLCEKLIEEYSWKGATWIIAGLCLNGIVCGVLFKPLEVAPRKRSRTIQSASNSGSKTTEKLETFGLPCTQVSTEPKDVLKQRFSHNGYCTEPTKGMIQSMQNLCTESSKLETTCLSQSCDDVRMKRDFTRAELHQRMLDLKRPMYRKDILYSGSVQQLAEYRGHDNVESYVRSVTSIPVEHSPREHVRCWALKRSCKSLCDTLREMVDFSLMKNPVFCIYGMSCFLCMTGFFVPFIYLPDVAITYGMSRDQAAFSISIIGIANTVARVACGWISDQPWADCLIINNCALVIGGVATMLCPFCKIYPLLGTYSFVFGSCIAAFVSLRSIIMVDLMGLDKLTNAFGLVTMCQGLSAFIGAPIAGALFDATGEYNLSFYVAGTTLAMAGAICFPLRRVAAWWHKRELRQQLGGSTVADAGTIGSSGEEVLRILGNGETDCVKV